MAVAVLALLAAAAVAGVWAWRAATPTHAERVYGGSGSPAGPPATAPVAGREVRLVSAAMPWGERGGGDAALRARVKEASALAPDLLVFPEGFPATGPERLDSARIATLGRAVRAAHGYVLLTLLDRRPDGVSPTSLLFDRSGRHVGTYRQTHRLPGEGIALGDSLPIFDLDFGRMAVLIGSDAYFPELDMLYRQRGARLVVWPGTVFPVDDPGYWDAVVRGRALDNDIFVLTSRFAPDSEYLAPFLRYGSVGTPMGRSGLVDPDGTRRGASGLRGRWAVASVAAAELARAPADPATRTAGRVRLPLEDWVMRTPPTPRPFPGSRRRVVLSAVHQDLDATPSRSFDRTLALVDEAGRRGSDLTVLYEFSERIDGVMPALRERARAHHMYLVVTGATSASHDVESVVVGRDGGIVGRYRKITENAAADTLPVFDLDFGRVGVRICADRFLPAIDRLFALDGVDVVVNPDQSWGEGAGSVLAREVGRSADDGFVYVRATHVSEEQGHLSRIVSAYGEVIAQSQHEPGVATAFVDLDDRPRAYAWDANDLRAGAKALVLRHVFGARPVTPDARPVPAARGTLRDAVLASRRPELYARYAVPGAGTTQTP